MCMSLNYCVSQCVDMDYCVCMYWPILSYCEDYSAIRAKTEANGNVMAVNDDIIIYSIIVYEETCEGYSVILITIPINDDGYWLWFIDWAIISASPINQ